MAHKTLIGGTAYEITGGKTLVNGTAYSIKSGKTLIGGTVYEVGFGKSVPDGMYLTFASDNAFTLKVKNSSKKWDGTLYYYTDSWNVWDATEISSSMANDGRHYLYLRGSGNTRIGNSSYNYRWVLNGSNVSCEGNIETLLDYETVENGNHPSMAKYCYMNLFYGCTALTTAPELPATTLVSSCYTYMFSGCTSLTTLPALPATDLIGSCYQYMFSGCTNIKISETKSGEYTTPYRIPTSGTGTATDSSVAVGDMFTNTGGTFTGTPNINTTYYTSNTVV